MPFTNLLKNLARSMRVILVFLVQLATFFSAISQSYVLTYGDKIDPISARRKSFNSFLLPSKKESDLLVVLKDEKKIQYVLLNNFAPTDRILSDSVGYTPVLIKQSGVQYLGGSSNGQQFHLVYLDKDGNTNLLKTEHVDFANHGITEESKPVMQEGETYLTSFTEFNRFIMIAVNDYLGQMCFYTVDSTGILNKKVVQIDLKNLTAADEKLSDYFAGPVIKKQSADIGLEQAAKQVKLYSQKERLVFTVNRENKPTQVIYVSLPDFSLNYTQINHNELFNETNGGKSIVNTWYSNDTLFVLGIGKKQVGIGLYKASSATFLSKTIINDKSESRFAREPEKIERRGAESNSKEIKESALSSLLFNNDAAILARKNDGQWLIEVGNFHYVPPGFGTTSGGGAISFWTPNPDNNMSAGHPPLSFVSFYIPGRIPGLSRKSYFYNSIHFGLLLDQQLSPAYGKFPASRFERIKDNIFEINDDAVGVVQFSFQGKEYYGYYDMTTQRYYIKLLNTGN